jgi:hypothetical protein
MAQAEPKMVVRIVGQGGAGDQIFEAADAQEMVQKMTQAQEHATVKIREQEQALQEAQQRVSQYEQERAEQQRKADVELKGGFDKQQYFALLYNDPLAAFDYAAKYRIGRDLRDFLTEYDQVKQGAQIGMQQAINGAFVARHPELLQVAPADDMHNSKVISEILTNNNWQYSVDNLEAAYAVAKAAGKLKLPPPEPAASQVVEPPQPPVVSGRSPAPATGQVEEQEFLRTAPLEKVREYLENKFAGQPFAPASS